MSKKKIIIFLIIIVLTMVFSIFLFLDKREKNQYKNLNEKITKEIKIDSVSKIKNNKKLLDKYRYEYNNDEIVGKITIENTDFNMLFAQSKDNKYYLNHLINKKYNNLGATFLDYRNNIDSSKKINIYGHNNNRVGISFNYIMNYENQDFYKKHKQITISSNLKDYIYEIFSIQIVDKKEEYIHMKVDFNSNEEWNNYINNILDNSLYKENIDTNRINRVLTLQTCTNRADDEFLIVNARLVH